MSLPRFLTFVLGTGLILGLMLWLVGSIYQLYIQIAFSAPLLANLLVILIILMLGVLISIFVYYLKLPKSKLTGKRPKVRGRLPQLPQEKTEVAAETLKSLREQLDQMQDQVTREALLNRTREIEANLARGAYKVVIFGTGSAGKTSLVNALFGEMVGKVEATMGTTQLGETYQLKLPGLNKEILVTDTPGILEVGSTGADREELAKQLATEADLLLFVVDNDLRQSEYLPLKTLAEIGKRSILVFNKIDLYHGEDQQVIIEHLRERVKAFLSPVDVVAIAANPAPVKLEDGTTVKSEPEIIPLIKRLVTILRAEGEDLIADNILFQSQQLGDEARSLLDSERQKRANKIIDRYQWIGAGVIAMTPLPVVDMLATAAVNTQMVVEIGQVYDCELNRSRGQELALSLGRTLISLGVVKGAIDLVARALQLNLATYILGKAIQGVSAAYLTRIAGKSFIEYFKQDQDWGDGGITEVVQKQFQLSRKDEFVKSFVQDAVSKVVKPLTESLGEDWEVIIAEPTEEDQW